MESHNAVSCCHPPEKEVRASSSSEPPFAPGATGPPTPQPASSPFPIPFSSFPIPFSNYPAVKLCLNTPIHNPPSHWPARYRQYRPTPWLAASTIDEQREEQRSPKRQRLEAIDLDIEPALDSQPVHATELEESFAMEGVLETTGDGAAASASSDPSLPTSDPESSTATSAYTPDTTLEPVGGTSSPPNSSNNGSPPQPTFPASPSPGPCPVNLPAKPALPSVLSFALPRPLATSRAKQVDPKLKTAFPSAFNGSPPAPSASTTSSQESAEVLPASGISSSASSSVVAPLPEAGSPMVVVAPLPEAGSPMVVDAPHYLLSVLDVADSGLEQVSRQRSHSMEPRCRSCYDSDAREVARKKTCTHADCDKPQSSGSGGLCNHHYDELHPPKPKPKPMCSHCGQSRVQRNGACGKKACKEAAEARRR